MKKIDKYFKNLKIEIDDSHKQLVKEKILNSFTPVKKRINFNRIFAYAATSSAVLIVVILTVFSLNRFNFKKQLNDNVLNKEKTVLKEDKFVKEKENKVDILENRKEDDYIINKQINDKKTIDKPELKKGEEQNKGNNLFSYNAAYGNIDYSADEKKSYEKESIKRETAKDDYYDSKAELNQEILKKNIETKNKGLTDNVINNLNFISTKEFNKIVINPNFNTTSVEYLNNQISNNLSIDIKNVNDEEVINYLSSYYQDKDRDFSVESINYYENYYFLLINIKGDLKLNNEINVIFDNAVNSFYLYGYKDKNNNLLNAGQKNNFASILIIYYLSNKNIQNICSISYLIKNNEKIIKKSDISLPFNQVKNLDESSLSMRQAVLSFMILQKLKNNIYKKDEIAAFKTEYIDKKNFKLIDEHNKFIEKLLK